MIFLFKLFAIIPLFVFINSCSGDPDRDTSDLYAKSTTRGEIIARSGTTFRAGTDPKKMREQMIDAENRLQSGGGLFGKKAGFDFMTMGDNKDNQNYASVGLPINPYLWKGTLETVEFMPLLSADPFAGVILTDWFSEGSSKERCKLNIFIKGAEFKTTNLKVNTFCQTLSSNNIWTDQKVNEENNIKLENVILNRAKKIRLSQG